MLNWNFHTASYLKIFSLNLKSVNFTVCRLNHFIVKFKKRLLKLNKHQLWFLYRCINKQYRIITTSLRFILHWTYTNFVRVQSSSFGTGLFRNRPATLQMPPWSSFRILAASWGFLRASAHLLPSPRRRLLKMFSYSRHHFLLVLSTNGFHSKK